MEQGTRLWKESSFIIKSDKFRVEVDPEEKLFITADGHTTCLYDGIDSMGLEQLGIMIVELAQEIQKEKHGK